MEYKDIIFTKEDEIAFIKLNRPEVFNAFSYDMMRSTTEALADCDQDDSIRAIILSGEGKAFSSGGDLKQMRQALTTLADMKRRENVDPVGDAVKAVRNVGKPVIAQVHGAAAGGGCNLALMCDFRIAAEEAKFIESFVNVGLAPDTGGAYLLSRFVGVGRLTELLMTAKPLLAQEAFDLGLVTKVVKKEDLAAETLAFAKLLASKPGDSIRMIKNLINTFMYNRLDEELLLEKMFIRLLKRSDDHIEGVNAFVEKRQPVFNKK